MKRKTNFERYLEDQLKDKAFADRFRKAGEEWGKIMKVPHEEESLSAFRRARAVEAVVSLQLRSVEKGTDKISLDEINAEIKSVREKRA